MGNGTELGSNSQSESNGGNSTGGFKAGGEQGDVFLKADTHS